MKNKLIVLIVILVFISGCAALEKIFPKSQPTEPTPTKFVGGIGGIESEILSPSKMVVSANKPLPIAVSVKNTGEAEAEGTVIMCGLDIDLFPGFTSVSYSFSELKGITSEKKKSEPKILEIDGPIPLEAGENIPITAKTRYEYETTAVVKPCIKHNPYDKENQCQFKYPSGDSVDKLIGKSSKAPVRVKNVYQDYLLKDGDRLSMKLIVHIAMLNKKSEDIIGSASDTDCKSLAEDADNNRIIEVELLTVGEEPTINCENLELVTRSDYSVFKESGGEVECTVENIQAPPASYDIQPEYELKLKYSYEQRKTATFDIDEGI